MKTYKCIFVVLLVSIFIPSETFAQRWTSKASYPISIKYHTISSVNNKIYSIGGFTNTWVNYSYEYDPALNSWTPISRPPSGYYFLKSAVVNDKIYVFGYNGIELAVFEYDPALDSWITKTGKTGWRYTFSVASYNNKIYVIGGRDSSGVTDSVEEYDPVLDSWQTKTPMTTARQSAAAVEYNGKIYVAGGNNGGTLFSTFEVYDPTLDSWTSKPSMQIPRKELELQVLEGNIYAMGGSDSTPLTTVEEYNINSETWAVTDTMSTSRESFASGVVNNIIYAVGGQSTPSLTDVNEAFNASSPETPAGITAASGDLNVLLTWNSNTEIDLSKYVIYRSLNDGFSPVPADSIGLTLIPDTTFSDSSVANGINYYYRLSAVDSTGNISEFSSQVTAFPNDTTKPAAPVNLAGSPGNTVVDLSWSANSESDLRQYNIYRNLSSGFTPTSSDSVGFVLKPDSTFSDSSLTNNVTYYYQIAALDSSLNLSSFSNEVSVTPVDLTAPTSLRWISKASHPLNLKYHTISSVNNKLYSIGGFTNTWIRYTYEYDPALNSWTPKTQMPSGYYFLKSAIVNDKIYVIGYNGVELAVFEYDPALNSWITKNGKTSWRYTFSVASYNSKIYVIGGRDSSGVTDSVEEYDPLLDTWQTKTAMPTARQSAAAVEYNGKIYVAGGNVSSQLLSTFEVYDPVLDSWTSKPSMLVPRKELELQEVDGIIYAMGGTDNSPLTLVESYDVNSDSWEVNDSMLTPRESFASGVANNVIYAVGGQSTSSLTNVNEAFGALQPSTPTGITTSFGDRNVFLVWNSNIESDLSKYVIYKSLNFGFSPLPSDSIGFNLFPDTTFNDTSVVSGITYYYRLSAVDTSGNISAFSSQVSATPQLNAPSAPVNLEGSPAKNASHLSWSANSEPDLRQYKIYRSLTPGFTPTALDSVGFVFKPDTTFSDLSLTNGITYYYQIAALDSTAHHSDFSNEVSVTPADLVSPAAPSNLTATGVNESIDLVWDLSSETDIEKYILYRSQTDGFSPQPSDSLGFVTASDSTFSDSAVTVGQIYYYRVSAIDSALNESAFSNQASAIPIDTVAPAIPVNLTAVEGTDRYIDLSWDANTEPDLTDYIIYRSQLNDFSPSSSDSIAFVTSPAVTYRDSALVIGTTYYYKIAAIDTAFNYSGFSTQDYGAAIDTTAPNTPQNLTAADGSDNVLLEWDQNVESDLLKYTIYRSTTPGFSPVPGDSIDIAASTDTTFTDTLAAVNTTYYYRISASDSLNQESSFSNEASATPFDPVPPAAPTNLIASAGNSQVSLVWDLNSETDMNTYIVYRSQTPGFTPVSSNAIGVNTHPDITYTDNDVYNNATYYYKIAATDSLNNISTFSNEASATPVPLLNYSWQTKAVMTTARFASASATYDGKIYTAGGRTGTASNEISDLLEEYDPNTNTWAPKDTMLTIRENFAGDILSDKLIIIGGEASGTKLKTVEAYKPTTDSWDTQTSISSKRRSLSVTSLGGKLYAIGGRRRNKAYRDDNEEYDPVTDVWVNRTIMPTTRYAHASTAYNGKIYVIGGDNGSYLGTLEAYDQATDTWTTLTPMPTPRRNLTFNTLAGRLYAIGGEDGSGHLPTVEIYDPGTDTWVAGDSMLTARYDHSAAVVDDIKLYAIGGYDGSTVLNTNEVYDPPPWKPLNLQAATDAPTVNLTWDANIEPDLDYYIIYKDTSDSFTPGSANVIASVTGGTETFADTDVEPLTTYYYKISAVDTVGQESQYFSDQASVLTPDLAFSLASLDSTFTNGDTVRVNLTFFGNYNSSTVTSFQFTLNFDSTQINGIGIDTIGFGSSAMIISNVIPGQLKVAAAILDSLRGSNKVMQIVLEVDDDAQLGSALVSFSNALFNEGIPIVDLNTTSISITPRFGDVSANSVVNAYDASMVLQHVVGIEEFSTGRQAKADVTYNGAVTALDAYYILLKSAGFISTFPSEDSLFSKIAAVDNPDIDISILKQADKEGDIIKFTFDAANVNNISSFYTEFDYNMNDLRFRKISISEEYSDNLYHINENNGHIKFAMTGYDPGENNGELVTFEFENITTGRNTVNLKIGNIDVLVNEQYIQPDFSEIKNSQLPDKFDLAQNYPNPFNPVTTIKFQIPEVTSVSIVVYNVLGQEVRTLVNEVKDVGFHSVRWNGRNNLGINVGQGVYIYRIKAGKFILTRKMLLIK